MASRAAKRALHELDRILGSEPKADGQRFSFCIQELCKLRDEIIAEQPAGTKLAHANALISVVMAGRFPLGEVPWAELHKARDWLAELA